MKYFILLVLSILICPYIINAANTDFKQQIRTITQCNDSVDNDGDGLIDFASDTDCISWEDNNESTEIQPILLQPKPIPQLESSPKYIMPNIPIDNQPIAQDYIISESIQYILLEDNTFKQADTYENRVRLNNILSLIIIGGLSFIIWAWDFFLNTYDI